MRKNRKEKSSTPASGIGVSKAVLIELYSVASAFSHGSHRDHLKNIEKFADQLEGISTDQVKRSLYYLRSKNLVSIQREYGESAPRLTKVGWLKARSLAKSLVIERPIKWDNKWRMVIFDIPVEKRSRAEAFRNDLKLLGFANLQKSIWIYPYECKDQVYYLAKKYEIQPSVRYVVADYITGREDLSKRFDI